MERFVRIVNGWLAIITKGSILDVAAVLDPCLGPENSQSNSQIWTNWPILLNKIKPFEAILAIHGLVFCSGSFEIARI